MASVEEAQKILRALGMPAAQTNQMAGMTLLALCGLTPGSPWSDATRSAHTITKGLMNHLKEHFGTEYAANTRETFRRQVLHQFVQGRIADYNPFEPDLPTNSPRAHYAIAEAAVEVVQLYGTGDWESAVAGFRENQGALVERYERERQYNMVPVRLPEGQELQLSPGKHNEVQKAVVEEFAPRFVPGAHLLYLGDTANKHLFVDSDRLTRLGIPINEHDKLPDVLLYDEVRGWLVMVEAVTSHGPVTPKRIVEIEEMMAASSAVSVYVTAFPDFAEYRKHMTDIAWETEVWLADTPDHMIHYNGDRFLGPRTGLNVLGRFLVRVGGWWRLRGRTAR